MFRILCDFRCEELLVWLTPRVSFRASAVFMLSSSHNYPSVTLTRSFFAICVCHDERYNIWWPETFKFIRLSGRNISKFWWPEHEKNYENRVFWWPEQVEKLKISMFWWPEQIENLKISIATMKASMFVESFSKVLK